MKQNDEDLSELELKSFWYKLKKSICPKMDLIMSFSIFDEPKIKLKVINVVTRLCNTRDCSTSL